jgi:hypothetical protein
MEQALNRLVGGVVFGALLIGGALVYSSNQLYGEILFAASALALLWIIFLARGHRSWP